MTLGSHPLHSASRPSCSHKGQDCMSGMLLLCYMDTAGSLHAKNDSPAVCCRHLSVAWAGCKACSGVQGLTSRMMELVACTMPR